jgi:hypothetical protein
MKCGVTKKIMFKTHEKALIRGGEILIEDTNRDYTPEYFTAYCCEFCGFYHLTGKYYPKKQFDKF